MRERETREKKTGKREEITCQKNEQARNYRKKKIVEKKNHGKTSNRSLAPVFPVEPGEARHLEEVVEALLLDLAAPVPRRGEPAVDAGPGVE